MTTRKKRWGLAVDIDNVLAGAEREVQRIYVELTHKPWPRTVYASAGGLDDNHFDSTVIESIFDYFHEKSIPILPLLPGARFALQLLACRYRLVIITARRPTSRKQTLAWLEKHQLPFDELYHTEEKAGVPEEIHLAVDDHPGHVRRYGEQGIPVFLMDQPWNRGFTHPLSTRVVGWDSLIHTLHVGKISSWPPSLSESPNLKTLLHETTEEALIEQ